MGSTKATHSVGFSLERYGHAWLMALGDLRDGERNLRTQSLYLLLSDIRLLGPMNITEGDRHTIAIYLTFRLSPEKGTV